MGAPSVSMSTLERMSHAIDLRERQLILPHPSVAVAPPCQVDWERYTRVPEHLLGDLDYKESGSQSQEGVDRE